MTKLAAHRFDCRLRGHTLIELMVAIIIGLLMVLAAFQVLANFEGNKRTTTAMNDALQSGNFGIYELDKLIRSAGTGVSQYGAIAGYGCPLNYTSASGATVSAGAVTLPAPFNTLLANAGVGAIGLAPAVIFPNAPAGSNLQPGSDALMLMLGGSGFGEAPIPITPSSASGGSVTVDSTVGMASGEWILLGTAGSGACMVTKVDPSFLGTTNGNVILPLTPSYIGAVAVGGFVNGYAVPLGMGPAANFALYGIGSADDSLYSFDLLNAPLGKSQPVSDDIIAMHAVYGVSPAPGGVMTWVKPAVVSGVDYTPKTLLSGSAAANTTLHTIRAIRVGIVVRAPLAEKADPITGKNVLTGNSFNSGGYTFFQSLPLSAQYAWTVPADQTNYRYREIETTIPIRNSYF